MEIILSIKPKYVKEIITHHKIYEYRKSIPKRNDVTRVYIYCSSPVKAIVAIFDLKEIIHDDLTKLWRKTHNKGCVNKNTFDKYYKNRTTGYAIKISNLKVFSRPLSIDEICPGQRPPQSFCYVKNEEKNQKRNSR